MIHLWPVPAIAAIYLLSVWWAWRRGYYRGDRDGKAWMIRKVMGYAKRLQEARRG